MRRWMIAILIALLAALCGNCLAEGASVPARDRGAIHNYILIIDDSRGASEGGPDLRFDAARLAYENLLTSAEGKRGQLGAIAFSGKRRCDSFGPMDLHADRAELDEAIGDRLTASDDPDPEEPEAGLNRALNAARRMVNQFAPKSDTSILLLTDQTDLTDRSVDPRVTERAVERMEGLRADGAKLYVAIMTGSQGIWNAEVYKDFIEPLALAGGGERDENGHLDNVESAAEADIGLELLRLLIKTESDPEEIQQISGALPVREAFRVPYEGIARAVVSLAFALEDKSGLNGVTLTSPEGEEYRLWDEIGAREQTGIGVTGAGSCILLDIPSPAAGDWTLSVEGNDPGTAVAVMVRLDHGLELKAHMDSFVSLGAPQRLEAWFERTDGSGRLTDSELYDQSDATLELYEPRSEEVSRIVEMTFEDGRYVSEILPDRVGIWSACVKVENPYLRERVDSIAFEAMIGPTPEPTPEPTPGPTVETTPEPTPEPMTVATRRPRVAKLNRVVPQVAPVLAADGALLYVDGSSQVTVDWEIDGQTDRVEAVLARNGEVIQAELQPGDALDPELLEPGVDYELVISAMPKNGSLVGADPVVETLPFRIAPTVVPVEGIEIEMAPAITDVDGVKYADRTAEAIGFTWTIDGESDGSEAQLLAEGEDAPVAESLNSGDSVDRALLQYDRTYTLMVSAMPKNGTLVDAEPFVETMSFRLYPQPEPIGGLSLSVSDASEKDGVYRLEATRAEMSWHVDRGEVDHFELIVMDPEGRTVARENLPADRTTYSMELYMKGDHRLVLSAVPKHALAESEYTRLSVILRPHYPGFLEQNWPFLAGGAAGLAAIAAALMLLFKKKEVKKVVGRLRVICEDPDIDLDATLVFSDSGKGVRYNEPLTTHPAIARLKGKKAYDLLSGVRVAMAQTDGTGRAKGIIEPGTVQHQPDTNVITLTDGDSKGKKGSACCVGRFDTGIASMMLGDGSGRNYRFVFTSGGDPEPLEEAVEVSQEAHQPEPDTLVKQASAPERNDERGPAPEVPEKADDSRDEPDQDGSMDEQTDSAETTGDSGFSYGGVSGYEEESNAKSTDSGFSYGGVSGYGEESGESSTDSGFSYGGEFSYGEETNEPNTDSGFSYGGVSSYGEESGELNTDSGFSYGGDFSYGETTNEPGTDSGFSYGGDFNYGGTSDEGGNDYVDAAAEEHEAPNASYMDDADADVPTDGAPRHFDFNSVFNYQEFINRANGLMDDAHDEADQDP